MKALAILLALGVGAAHAAEPVVGRITVTARLAHDGRAADGPVDLRLSLFATATGGTSLWSEDHAGVPAVAGLVSFEIGGTEPLTTSIFDGTARYLEIEVAGQRLSPRLAIGSVPYALRAERAGQVGSLGEADIQRRVAMACPPDQMIASIGPDGSVACAGYTGANGVAITGGQIAADTAFLQRRVSAACPAGQSIRAIAGDGGVTCEADDNTTYTAGPGILIDAANRITPDFAQVQRRVGGPCPNGTFVQGLDAAANPICAGYVAGAGLHFAGSTFSLVATAEVALANTSLTSDTTDLGVHAFCALTHVEMQDGDAGNNKICRVQLEASGHWTLVARGGGSTQARCFARCL